MVDFMLNTWPEVKDAFPAEVRAEYIEKFNHPDTVHAICEEFRAAAILDYQHDEADRRNRRNACPCSSSGSNAARSRNFTMIRSRYGGSGPMTFAAARYQWVTSFQKRHPRRPHANC